MCSYTVARVHIGHYDLVTSSFLWRSETFQSESTRWSTTEDRIGITCCLTGCASNGNSGSISKTVPVMVLSSPPARQLTWTTGTTLATKGRGPAIAYMHQGLGVQCIKTGRGAEHARSRAAGPVSSETAAADKQSTSKQAVPPTVNSYGGKTNCSRHGNKITTSKKMCLNHRHHSL